MSISHDSVNRFLIRELYDGEDLFNEVKPLINLYGGTLRVDINLIVLNLTVNTLNIGKLNNTIVPLNRFVTLKGSKCVENKQLEIICLFRFLVTFNYND
jgi:hypothetical protein